MGKSKDSPAEDKKNTEQKLTDVSDAAANAASEKTDVNKPDNTGKVVLRQTKLKENSALSIYQRIEKIEAEIQETKDQDLWIKGSLKSKSTYDSLDSTELNRPTPDEKKVLRLTLKANEAFRVAAKAQIALERDNLNDAINSGSKELSNQIQSDKYNSPYFLKKNKGHIRKNIVGILSGYKSSSRAAFNEIKKLSQGRGSNQKRNFELKVLELIRDSNGRLYKQISGVSSFKNEMLDYIREQITEI